MALHRHARAALHYIWLALQIHAVPGVAQGQLLHVTAWPTGHRRLCKERRLHHQRPGDQLEDRALHGGSWSMTGVASAGTAYPSANGIACNIRKALVARSTSWKGVLVAAAAYALLS